MRKDFLELHKEQHLGIAAWLRMVSSAILALGLLVPFFKADVVILSQIVFAVSFSIVILAGSADFVSIAYRRSSSWTITFSPFLLLAWVSYWLF